MPDQGIPKPRKINLLLGIKFRRTQHTPKRGRIFHAIQRIFRGSPYREKSTMKPMLFCNDRENGILLQGKRFFKFFKENLEISLGFGFFWIWIWYALQTPTENPMVTNTYPLGILPYLVPLLFYAVGFFTLAILFYKKRIIPRSRSYRFCIPIMMVFGLIIFISLPQHYSALNPPDILLYIIGSAAIGLSSAFLHIEWGRISSMLGPRKTILCGAIGVLFACAALAIFESLPDLSLVVLLVGSAILSPFFVFRSQRSSKDIYKHGATSGLHISLKFIATAFVQGCSFGVFQIILLFDDQAESLFLPMIGFAFGAVLLTVIAIRFKTDFNRLIYHVGFPIMSVGCLLISLFPSEVFFGSFIHAIGFRFVDILIWSLIAYVMKYKEISANWASSITTIWLIVGQIVGLFIGLFSAAILPGLQGLASLSAIMIFALMLCALFATSSQNIRTGWGMVHPSETDSDTSSFDHCCQIIAKENNLTVREMEVFTYLAKGFPRKYICEKLVIADGTVKTHIRSIYQKLNIHSRQEAMKLVESSMANFAIDSEPDKPMPII